MVLMSIGILNFSMKVLVVMAIYTKVMFTLFSNLAHTQLLLMS